MGQIDDVRAWRSTKRYRTLRRRFMAKNPTCAMCEKQGLTVAAKELDHIIPASDRPDLFWDTDNMQALCVDCHMAKTAAENKDQDPEWLARFRDLYGSD